MSAANMSLNVIDAIDETLRDFKPRSKFDIIKVGERKRDYVEHQLLY